MLEAVIIKNTFLTFIVDDAKEEINSVGSPHMPVRSRSAEIRRSRPFDEKVEKLTREPLQRLTDVLCGVSSPSPLQAQKERLERQCDGEALQSWQDGLAKAFDRVDSHCSVSTMAPDVSEGGESPRKFSSTFSMISTVSDDASEGGDLPNAIFKKMPRTRPSSSGRIAADTRAARSGLAPRVSNDVMNYGGVSERMTHGRVPKTQRMADMCDQNETEASPTTMMIRNIPGRHSQDDLIQDLDDMGFARTYDFLYMPMDKGTSSSVGYAFVNFVDASWAAKCKQVFDNYRWKGRRSRKIASVSVAHLQGLEKNLQHYGSAAVTKSNEKRCRPMVMSHKGQILD
jgi:hypothetical protein